MTNGLTALQHKKIKRAGFAPHFRAVVISGELGTGKPAPVMFATALERLGVPPQHAIMAGDDLGGDVAGAQRAGIKAIWVQRAAGDPLADVAPDATVNTLSALPGVVASLLG